MTLQQQWDIWLVAAFKQLPNMQVMQALGIFAARMETTIDGLYEAELKRLPRKEGQGRFCRVTRFVCGYIPGAAEFIFETTLNPIQKATKLSKCGDARVEPVDVAKTKAESRERSKTKRAFKVANAEYSLGNLQREAYGRRNWSACK